MAERREERAPAPTGHPRHILLVGLPGAGKTVCGALLAQRLGRPFLDLDHEIERLSSRSVAEIFERLGEGHFRDLETEATEALSEHPPSVVAPGGGWIEREGNRAIAQRSSRMVYLRVSPGTALTRLGAEVAARPLLRGEDPLARIVSLLDRRGPLYAMADIELDTEVLSPKEVVDQLARLALRWGGPVG